MEVSPSCRLELFQALCILAGPRLLVVPAIRISELVLMHAVSSSLLQCDAG